jgi:hypothetical protein
MLLRSLLIVFLLVSATVISKAASEVRVILWFDTEDYLLPADDDASKRLAEMLTEKGVRATFKVVGEKARVLEKRGRRDVIAALQKHDIGYHANFHSVHPTPSEYLADCEFLDGVAEFVRREGGGAADVRRIFNVPTLSCYGQPGSSWGSQTLAGLKAIGVAPSGVPCYVDEGDHVGYHGVPFWYENAIVVYNMGDNWTRMDLHDPATEKKGHEKVAAIAERLRSQSTPGLISIFYHPCEWVHKEFWDGVNFKRGANPPREKWKPPGQLSTEATEAAFQRFSGYIDFIKSLPGIRFVTAGDLPSLYADQAKAGTVTKEEVKEIASRISNQSGIDAQIIGTKVFSPADQFEILLKSCASFLNPLSGPKEIRVEGLLGPDAPCGNCISLPSIDVPALRPAVGDVMEYLKRNGRIPARIFIGSDSIRPSDFLVALADATLQHFQGDLSAVKPGKETSLLTEKHIAKDTAGLFGGWVIHKEGFRAPKILEVARLQAWTLKPALPR